MPVTRRGNPLYDNIDQTNAAGFLFRDDESNQDTNNYNALDTTGEDGFPKLIKGNPNRVSSCSHFTLHSLPFTQHTSTGTGGSMVPSGSSALFFGLVAT